MLSTTRSFCADKFKETPSKHIVNSIFGWTFERLDFGDHDYSVVKNNGMPIAGIIHLNDETQTVSSGEWISAMSVDNVEGRTLYNEKNGGKTLKSATDLPGRGMTAVIEDP